MNRKLLPCPFCGGESFATGYESGDTFLFKAYCSKCQATMRGFDQCQQDAADAWNTRAALRASAAPEEGITLRLTLAEYARDLRRNPSGGDDYPFEIMNAVANRIDEILAARAPATEGGGDYQTYRSKNVGPQFELEAAPTPVVDLTSQELDLIAREAFGEAAVKTVRALSPSPSVGTGTQPVPSAQREGGK